MKGYIPRKNKRTEKRKICANCHSNFYTLREKAKFCSLTCSATKQHREARVKKEKRLRGSIGESMMWKIYWRSIRQPKIKNGEVEDFNHTMFTKTESNKNLIMRCNQDLFLRYYHKLL